MGREGDEEDCSGQERYLTFALAKRIARRRRRASDNEPLQAYRCPFCHAIHIGARPRPSRHMKGRHGWRWNRGM